MAAVRIDLHVHSSASDGTDDPAEVMRRAAAAGLDVVALTDHDTQAGVDRARAALAAGLTLVPGIELSCQLGEPSGVGQRSVHLLGYLFDPADPELAAEAARIRDDRTYRARAMTERLAELGTGVTWEQVSAIAGDSVVGRPHLARALLAAGAIGDTAEAFTLEWIGDGGRAFVGRYAPGLERAVGLIQAAGGVAVLAHPRSPGYEVPYPVIEELAGAGLDGVEVFHFDHDAAARARLAGLAAAHDLIMTGGSDDHGEFQPSGAAPGPAAGAPVGSGGGGGGDADGAVGGGGTVGGLGRETTPPPEYERLLARARRGPVTGR
jgi:predicted metal-dependent phosphoesterase TrpH